MRPFLLSIAFIFFCDISNAQVRTNINNDEVITARGKFKKNYTVKPPYIIPPQDVNALYKKELQEVGAGQAKPFKIAEAIPVDINVVKEASWVEEVGYSYGSFTIIAAGAKSISVNFDQFKLPEDTQMFVYSENGEMITGPVTENENNENNFWGSWVYKGEKLTVEIKSKSENRANVVLHISSVAYGYKDIYQPKVPSGNFGTSGSCNINALCPAGNGWENERNSVALILGGAGTALCTGAMVNNTGNLTIPYFLTANHCFDGAQANWQFFFHAWSPQCSPTQNATGIQFNGASLKARNEASDFMLLELNQLPPANSSIYAAGWSRSTGSSVNGVGIHHPSGDVMKISTYSTPLDRPVSSPFPSVLLPNLQHVWVVTWSQGVTEGGSSGSPLFDQDHRIVGQLANGPSGCGSPDQRDAYGRFDNSWTGGGTSSTRLSTWLNPNRSSTLTTETVLLCAPSASNATLIYPSGQRGVDPVTLCADCSYNFQVDYVAGATSYTWLLPPGFSFVSGSNTATPGIRTASANGTYTMYCSANNSCGSSWTHSLTINIGSGGGQQQMIAVFPNPTSSDLTIESTPSDLTIEDNSITTSSSLSNSTFRAKIVDQFNVELRSGISANGKIVFDVRNIQKGTYYLHIVRGQELITRQILIDK
ncbi:MAG: trypsin-like peptidase domain-containing protein [Cyclobacteriaceae bacterium]|nr:trypsin-like peptidase domain-containing protein [Cyclobacteriaceae bacterium]